MLKPTENKFEGQYNKRWKSVDYEEECGKVYINLINLSV